ncbi:unnamed protein product, partial [Mesorhabditis spiculigera]
MSDLDCSVCLERYDTTKHRPITINCGHTFCGECVMKIMYPGRQQGSNHQGHCPNCRVVIMNTAPNYTLIGMLDKPIDIKGSGNSQHSSKNTADSEDTLDLLRLQLGKLLSQNEQTKPVVDEAAEMRAQIEQLRKKLEEQEHRQQLTELRARVAELEYKKGPERQSSSTEKTTPKSKAKRQNVASDSDDEPEGDRSVATVNKKTAFIRGLPASATEKQIKALTNPYNTPGGQIRIKMYSPSSLGQCLVTFDAIQTAQQFIAAQNGKNFPGSASPMNICHGTFGGERALPDGLVADRKKVFIRNLPPFVDEKLVRNKILGATNPKAKLSVRRNKDAATCIIEFGNFEAAKKIVDSWNGKQFPGSHFHLNVDFWRILGEEQGSAPAPKTQNPKPVPQGSGITAGKFPGKVQQVAARPAIATNAVPQNRHNAPVMPQKGQPNAKQSQENITTNNKNKEKDNAGNSQNQNIVGKAVFIRNLPQEATPMDLIALFHGKARIAIRNGRDQIQFFPGKGPFQLAKVEFESKKEADAIVRLFDGTKLPSSSRVLSMCIWEPQKPKSSTSTSASTSTANPASIDMRRIVEVSNLPPKTVVNDVVALFHVHAKIEMDPRGFPKVVLKKTGKTQQATITFKEADGALKVCYLFNGIPTPDDAGGCNQLKVALQN